MRIATFEKQLAELLKLSVEGLDFQQKADRVRSVAEAYQANHTLERFSAHFEPCVPGRRPDDEEEYPGLGSSEEVALYHRGRERSDPFKLLIRCFQAGVPVPDFPPEARVSATIEALDLQGVALGALPGWHDRDIRPLLEVRGRERGRDGETGIPRALELRLDTNQVFAAAPVPQDASYLRFGSLFHQRFRIGLDVRVGGAWIAGDEHRFEIHNEELYGSLYQRLVDVLLPHDTHTQAAARGKGVAAIRVHPWYPVLSIGMQKARLYMKAIAGDLVEHKRMLTNPGWLLRVGLYLEYLTCLGIAEAVKDEIDILTPQERTLFETAPALDEIRRRIDVAAWREVWKLREIAFARTGDEAQAATSNLLRKQSATLGFLHAHHEDLKQAIDLAGPNLHNAQETWHRVFRDAERAVLQMNEDAFPELGSLPAAARTFALWHEKGRFGGLKLVPAQVTELFGDQDGVFLSACRQYRASMNHIAAWAGERGLMEYTGVECVPASASLLESHLRQHPARLARLQRRDGYAGTLDVVAEEREGPTISQDAAVAILQRVEIFSVLSGEEIEALAAGVRPIVLGPLERILIQGRPGSSLFILQDGTLEVIARVGNAEQRFALLQPPAVIGELAFLLGETRSATVRAVDYATVLELGAGQLRPLVLERPALLEALSRLLEERRSANREPAISGPLERIRRAIFGDEPAI